MTGTAVATVPAAAPAPTAHSPGTEVSGTPAQQLATFAKSLGLDVAPTQPAALPPPASNGGAWSQPVTGKHYRALTPAGEKLQRDVQAEYAKLSEAERHDPATIDLYNIALLHVYANEHGRVAIELSLIHI